MGDRAPAPNDTAELRLETIKGQVDLAPDPHLVRFENEAKYAKAFVRKYPDMHLHAWREGGLQRNAKGEAVYVSTFTFRRGVPYLGDPSPALAAWLRTLAH